MTQKKPSNAICPFCNSSNAKKNFLGLPKVFMAGPVAVGIVLIVFGVITIIGGMGSEDGLTIVIGISVCLLAARGLHIKSHFCQDCQKSFNWPRSHNSKYNVQMTLKADRAVETDQDINAILEIGESPESPQQEEVVVTPEKIGGWLILPAIGLPLVVIVKVLVIFQWLASELPSLYGSIFLVNLIFEVGLTVFCCYVLFCFFNKRRNTPVMIIALMVTNMVVNFMLGVISAVAEAQPLANVRSSAFVGGFIAAVIWIPYLLVSKRVKRTFVILKEESEGSTERNAIITESIFHDCPDCGAGGIIPDEDGKCTRCGYTLGKKN